MNVQHDLDDVPDVEGHFRFGSVPRLWFAPFHQRDPRESCPMV